MILELLKSLFAGAILISSMYVGGKCWHHFINSEVSFKSAFKFFGWTIVYVIALAILNSF